MLLVACAFELTSYTKLPVGYEHAILSDLCKLVSKKIMLILAIFHLSKQCKKFLQILQMSPVTLA